MNIHPLHNTNSERPERFTYPFNYEPHPLCREAAAEVQQYIATHEEIRQDADNGKMFGVLVVSLGPSSSHEHGDLAFLAAYSGLLAGRNDWPYFVPPIYDAQQPDGYFKMTEREISARGGDKEMSQDLQTWLFHQYQLLNAHGEVKDLVDVWQSYYSREKLRKKFPLPPGGTGDCCAPKLLQYAYLQGLYPVCMAEFWWGAPTRTELRQHLNYYPACRGKCKPILTWMLQGLDVDPNPETLGFEHKKVPVVYEDDDLLVVDKPSGMLSVPGRIEDYSIETLMQERYPSCFVAHRLDMGTSGLLIVAKNIEAYHHLQQRFVRHEVRKKYVAKLEHAGHGTGIISLPLRPDPMNRPRQMVDMEHGKRSVTRYEFISDRLVALWPETGRTHQLRIHCAHPDGLGRPIIGDELYGTKAERLCLHAAEIWFTHPSTDREMHFTSPIPFQI
jgi:tRNA pseudouridine32 synthase/23S rRNA pseudouridine746 synthase